MGMLGFCAICSVVGLALFLLLFHYNPASLLNGLVFDCELAALLGLLLCFLAESRLDTLCAIVLTVLMLLAMLLVAGGIWIVIGYLLFNAVQVFRREKRTLQNMLSLLVGLGLLVQIIVFFAAQDLFRHRAVLFAAGFLVVLEGWLFITAVCFVSAGIICRMDKPRLGTDYIIVLGSGLINGSEVSPLLGGRIDCALRFYEKSKQKGYHPKLVFSGGQGADETVPEAIAMQRYALEYGVPFEDTLTESKSCSTLENFSFSKQQIETDSAGKPYSCAYATSDYHVLRARLYARKAGMPKARGISARTASYYVTNATIREYVAVMLNNKRSNLIQLGLVSVCYIALVVMLELPQ